MGQITSSVGIISGINTGAIITELLALDELPVTQLNNEITQDNAKSTALNALGAQLQTLETIGNTLELPQTFEANTTTSSNPNVLTATAGVGAPQGSYQFQVAQLVSSQQSISNGYASTSAPLQAGTISFEVGGGSLDTQTPLSELNGGAGISQGQFRITDSKGNTEVIDTSTDVNLNDVLNQINNSTDVGVQASVQDNHLVLSDTSGGTGALKVQDLAGGSTAQDLGISGSASNGTLTGSAISYLSTGTALSALNDGRGITTAANGASDFTITAGASTYSVNLSTAQTVGDVLNAINTATGGNVTASIAAGASGITLTGPTGSTVSVAATNGSQAAADLGIEQNSSTNTITGRQVLSNPNTVLVSSLEGGSGIALGTISIGTQDGTNTPVDLSGDSTVQDILDSINTAGGGKVTASLNSSGDGIQLTDNTTGSHTFTIADTNGGTTAQSLGIAGSFSQASVQGSDLHLQYVTGNTLLSNYNGGKGVSTGSFQITNSAGVSTTIDLSQGTFNTLGDVINAINQKNIGVTASINATGNGLLLTDNAGGPGEMAVTDTNGTTASDLNIAGTAIANTIDGAEEKSIQVTSTDTLATLQQKIQQLGFGVSASIINDGSSQSPYRLSLTALNSGTAGQVVINTGTTGLQVRNLVNAQNAAVFVGGTGSAQPLLVTSSTNQLSNIIPGVTLSLQSASSTPVTLSVTRDGTNVATQLQNFTTAFNSLVGLLNTYTAFNTTTDQGGILMGDSTALEVQQEMYQVFSSVVSSAGSYRTLGDVGMTLTDGAKISFDADTFNSAFAANPNSVQTLFSQTSTGLGAVISNSLNSLVDPITGLVAEENSTLTTQNQNYQNQITQLNSVIADKKTLLETQFANMETVLAGLQAQGATLGGITSLSSTKTSSSSSSSSSSG